MSLSMSTEIHIRKRLSTCALEIYRLYGNKYHNIGFDHSHCDPHESCLEKIRCEYNLIYNICAYVRSTFPAEYNLSDIDTYPEMFIFKDIYDILDECLESYPDHSFMDNPTSTTSAYLNDIQALQIPHDMMNNFSKCYEIFITKL